MTKVLTRDCTEVDFDKSKISTAILKAMKNGSGIVKTKIAEDIANEIEEECKNKDEITIDGLTKTILVSGMCQIGRIRHHLKQNIPNQNATILFVGYSTEGSLASILKDNKRRTVTIDQKEYQCRCSSYSLKSMSGHAPYKQLIEDYTAINCQKIILHHGSALAKETLKKALDKEFEKLCKSTRVVIANSSLKFTV